MSAPAPALLAEALPWGTTRLGAALLLLVWVAALAVFSGRELRFLAGLDSRLRRQCLIQHSLLQVAVLLILIPCITSRAPSVPLFSLVLAGFVLLWLAGGWSLLTRYTYTSRLLNEYRQSAERRALGLSGDEDTEDRGGSEHDAD